MSNLDPESLHRTMKLELDSGRAGTTAEAAALLRGYRCQIDVAPGALGDPATQAAVFTAIATATRAFLGGVAIRFSEPGIVMTPWMRGSSILEAATSLGASVVSALDPSVWTICFGAAPDAQQLDFTLFAVVDGWTALVGPRPHRVMDGPQSIAGVLAGALAVSEVFQRVRGDAVAGRRPIAINLWNVSDEVAGPTAPSEPALPASLWLVGLGHLGQAYAWTLAMLDYESPRDVTVVLQDTDVATEANISTGLLTVGEAIGTAKTRVVADALEAIGMNCRLVERRFDAHTRPQPDEPSWVLGGLDSAPPRRQLVEAGFLRYVDAGIGAGFDSYLDIVVQTFPSQQAADEAFPDPLPRAPKVLAPAYEQLVEELTTNGVQEGTARCGVLEMAGVAVGASFVGATAASLVLADVIRSLNGAPCDLAVVNLDLREPRRATIAANERPGPPTNPGFTRARSVTD